MSSSTVTYTSISSDYEEPSDAGSPRVVVYGYDKLPMHPIDPYVEAALQAPEQAPPSPDYVLGPKNLPYLDYVPGPKEPEQKPLYLDYVPEPEYLEYPEYLAPSDASPTALSLGYVADSYSKEDPEEDLEEDHADYLADGGDNADDESSDVVDDDDDDKEQEASEDDDEEEEHLALADSFVVPTVDPIPLAKDTEYASAPTLPSPPPSLLSPLSSPFPQIPSPPLPLPSPPTSSAAYAEAPLGYKAAKIQLRAASPSTYHPSEIPSPPLLLPFITHRDDLPKEDMPLQKRARFTAPTGRFEVGESSSAVDARQAGHTLAHTVDYGIIDTMDASIRAAESRAMTTVGVVNDRVTDLAAT
ncbi:hypothetical protein Tco_0031399 [Tanacetum coccineum]